MKIPKEVARQREDAAWELRQKGWTQQKIADELGITQTGVYRALRRAEARVLKRMGDRIAGIKATQHAQLEHVIMEAMSAWERSKADVKTIKVTKDGDGGKIEKTLRTTPGNPQFLSEARGAMADVRKLWNIGMDDEGETWKDAYDGWADKQKAKPREVDPLPVEVAALKRSYLAFGGDEAEFTGHCSDAERVGPLGSPSHLAELRRLAAPAFRLALRKGGIDGRHN